MRPIHVTTTLLLAALLAACSSVEPTRPEADPNQAPPAAITPPTAPAQGEAVKAPLPGQDKPAVPAMRIKTVRDVQQRLTELGYDPGAADGVAGPRTAAALRQFQNDRGLRPTGRMDSPTREALGTAR